MKKNKKIKKKRTFKILKRIFLEIKILLFLRIVILWKPLKMYQQQTQRDQKILSQIKNKRYFQIKKYISLSFWYKYGLRHRVDALTCISDEGRTRLRYASGKLLRGVIAQDFRMGNPKEQYLLIRYGWTLAELKYLSKQRKRNQLRFPKVVTSETGKAQTYYKLMQDEPVACKGYTSSSQSSNSDTLDTEKIWKVRQRGLKPCIWNPLYYLQYF